MARLVVSLAGSLLLALAIAGLAWAAGARVSGACGGSSASSGERRLAQASRAPDFMS